ncbi:MAG: hypothetical protein ACLUI3_06850 [Christensenellales bacterium]
MNGLKLISTGRALPQTAVSNDDMRRYVETSDEWIASRTGIRQRAISAARNRHDARHRRRQKRWQPAV